MCKNVLGERCHIRNDNTEEKLRKHKLLRKWVNWQNWPELGLRDEGTRGLTVICTNGGATAGSITLYQTGPCWLNNNGISILAGPIFSSSFFQRSFLFDIWEFAWSWQFLADPIFSPSSFQRSFLFDIWEFAWSWQPTTVAEFQIGAKWSSTAHQRENFKLQILEILRNIHKINNKMFYEWSVRKALSQNG